MIAKDNSKRANQELLVLTTALPRLRADVESARAAVTSAESALDSLDDSASNGYGSRRLGAAQDALRSAQEWEARALKALHKAEARRARLGFLASRVAA